MYDRREVDVYISELLAYVDSLVDEVTHLERQVDVARHESERQLASEQLLGRALLQAQSLADEAIAEARAEAERVVSEARSEAQRVIEDATLSAEGVVSRANLEAARAAASRDAALASIRSEADEVLDAARAKAAAILDDARTARDRILQEARVRADEVIAAARSHPTEPTSDRLVVLPGGEAHTPPRGLAASRPDSPPLGHKAEADGGEWKLAEFPWRTDREPRAHTDSTLAVLGTATIAHFPPGGGPGAPRPVAPVPRDQPSAPTPWWADAVITWPSSMPAPVPWARVTDSVTGPWPESHFDRGTTEFVGKKAPPPTTTFDQPVGFAAPPPTGPPVIPVHDLEATRTWRRRGRPFRR